VQNILKELFAWKCTSGKVVNEVFGLWLAYNHAQHQSCTTCFPTLLSFQYYINLKLFYEQSLTCIVISSQRLDFVAINQIQV